MYKSLRRLTFLLAGTGILATIVMAAQGYWLQSKMLEEASTLNVAKDVIADILPPPLYLIEPVPGRRRAALARSARSMPTAMTRRVRLSLRSTRR